MAAWKMFQGTAPEQYEVVVSGLVAPTNDPVVNNKKQETTTKMMPQRSEHIART